MQPLKIEKELCLVNELINVELISCVPGWKPEEERTCESKRCKVEQLMK